MSVLKSATITGIVKFQRYPSNCVCCEGDYHIFRCELELEPFESAYSDHFGFGVREFVDTHTVVHKQFEGKKVRITVEVLDE